MEPLNLGKATEVILPHDFTNIEAVVHCHCGRKLKTALHPAPDGRHFSVEIFACEVCSKKGLIQLSLPGGSRPKKNKKDKLT